MISLLTVLSLIINFLIAYNLNKIAYISNIFDEPDNKLKKHKSRVPLLDYRIVDFGYSLSNEFCFKNGWSKYILRKSINDSLSRIKWRKDKKGYTVPNDELIKKILPESKNLQFDFRKLCLERVINSI